MIRAENREGLLAALNRERAAGATGRARIALVPTMGGLHEGHLALVDRARSVADQVVMSVFVNPLQFGQGEDYANYPRDLDRDGELAAARGVDLLFAPPVSELYPRGDPMVSIAPGLAGDRLCGAHRPAHFRGVLTVVAKLFNIVSPDVAVFGQKDYQQVALIRRMVLDLDMPVRIEVVPVIRDHDGLALSSRNAYLSPEERLAAGCLYRSLLAAADLFESGERDPRRLCRHAGNVIRSEPLARLQYVQLVEPDSLEEAAVAGPGTVLAVAVHIGRTRLIDNMVLG